jgi:hypothetical protein
MCGGNGVTSSNNQVLDVTNGRGDCGGIAANDPLPLTWLGAVAPVVIGSGVATWVNPRRQDNPEPPPLDESLEDDSRIMFG